MPLIIPSNSISGEFEVANSLRFDDGSSDSLSRTPASAGNRKTWTQSFWCKRGNLTTTQHIGGTAGGSNTTWFQLKFDTADEFVTQIYDGTLATITSRKFRDISAWYHFVVTVDTSEATSTNRVKIWVNGEQQSLTHTRSLTLNQDTGINSTEGYSIGRTSVAYGNFYDGYISEYYLIDGQALTPTDFGEFDEDTGIWKPIKYTGTYGTNGFYLDFENSGSLGADQSGNGNNFTVNNLTSIDQTTDTPTNNYATWNVLSAYNSTTASTLSEGNLKSSGAGADGGIPSTIGVSSGKWYWEVKFTDEIGGDPVLGIINSAGQSKMQNANSGSVTSGSGVWCLFNLTSGGVGIQENGVFSAYPPTTLADGDILNIALDVDAQKLWYGKNGTWYNSGNPATGTNATSTNLTANETWFAYIEKRNSSSISETNFGNPSFTISSGNSDGNGYGNFEYAVPSGYYALNTKNLAEYG